MRQLQYITLVCLLLTTGILFAQQDVGVVDAVQNQRIMQIESATNSNAIAIIRLDMETSELRSGLDRMWGVGAGAFGILSLLQAMNVILVARNGRTSK